MGGGITRSSRTVHQPRNFNIVMLKMLKLLDVLELINDGFNNCPATQQDTGVVTKVFSFLETFILP